MDHIFISLHLCLCDTHRCEFHFQESEPSNKSGERSERWTEIVLLWQINRVSSVLLHQSQNRNSGWFLSPQDFTVELLGENPTTGWQTAHPLGFGNRTFPLKKGLLFFVSRDDSVDKGLVSVKILWLLNLMSKMMWKSASDENRTSGKWLRDVEECWPEYLET